MVDILIQFRCRRQRIQCRSASPRIIELTRQSEEVVWTVQAKMESEAECEVVEDVDGTESTGPNELARSVTRGW